MPLPTESGRGSARVAKPPRNDGTDPVTQRVLDVADGLDELLAEAAQARVTRAEEGSPGAAVCAWNHFENIPTFYNWNNRPR